MVDLENMLRKNIKRLLPYSTARDEYPGEIGIFLDANENSFGSIPEGKLNRYPDPLQKKIKRKLASIKNVGEKNIFIGNGSDEAIDLVLRAFCEPGKDSVLIMPPTYGMYKVAVEINDAGIIEVPLNEYFDIAEDKVLSKITEFTKVIFICSPNNPTGNLMSAKAIEKILNNFNGIVVIDEAYGDFTDAGSWVERLGRYKNLIVLQTFSKAWGLANIRVGALYADQFIISVMNKIKYPYNVSGVSQQIILNALDNNREKEMVVDKIISERDRLKERLENFNFIRRVFHSDANFLLAEVNGATEIYNFLLKNGVIVRNRSNIVRCKECLRFTVGTEKENDKLIELLSRYGA